MRVRYFSDGAVLGSKELGSCGHVVADSSVVQGYFEGRRDRFGAKRRDGPRKMRGSDWRAHVHPRSETGRVWIGFYESRKAEGLSFLKLWLDKIPLHGKG